MSDPDEVSSSKERASVDDNFRGFALVQTYINAPSLETVIKRGRKFSEAELIELATKILDILTYLHQQNPPIIHHKSFTEKEYLWLGKEISGFYNIKLKKILLGSQISE